MIPPTSIDGTDITGATIDGTDVTEITVDGQTVFTAVSIPNSAVSQFKIDEGSGSTLNNEFSGQPNGSISGASWTSVSDLEKGFGLDFDGTDDYVNIGGQFGFTGPSATFSFAATVTFQTQKADQLIWSEADSQGRIYTINVDGTASDQISIGYFDGGGWAWDETTDSITDITSRHRIAACYNNLSNTGEIYIDAVNRSTGNPNNRTGTQVTGNTIGDWTRQNGLRAADMVLDNVIWYNKFLSSSEVQDDYDAQPWT